MKKFIHKKILSPARITGKIIGEMGSHAIKETPGAIKSVGGKISDSVKKSQVISKKLKEASPEVRERYGRMKRSKIKRSISDKAKGAVEGVKNTADKVVNTPLNKALDSGITTAVENPVIGAGQIGSAVWTVANPMVAARYPVGNAAIGAEAYLKKASPTYKKLTKVSGRNYERSKLHKSLSEANIPSISGMVESAAKSISPRLYTIQEGHYTGPKDLEKVPGSFEVIGKSTLGGTAAGGIIGGVLKEAGVDTSISEGMATGGKTGFIAGVIAKILLNTLHKPMKKVKFQEVDRLLRAKFGIYRVSGFTTGDTYQKRKTVEEKFGFNDRKIEDYKISFCIRDNQVTMYTLGISEEDLEKLNNSLDYYCKKFSGMGYTAKPINVRGNSYSVTITFTNYKAISDFIFEVSEVLGYKINLLDDNVLLEREATKEEQKEYSLPTLDKYDMIRILTKAGGSALGAAINGPKAAWCTLISKMITESFKNLRDQEFAKYVPSSLKNFGNSYLEDRLKEFGYIEGVHYTKDIKDRECNMRLDRGLFMIATLQGSKADKLLGKILVGLDKKEVKGKVNVWTGYIEGRPQFDILLKKIITCGANPNIFIG